MKHISTNGIQFQDTSCPVKQLSSIENALHRSVSSTNHSLDILSLDNTYDTNDLANDTTFPPTKSAENRINLHFSSKRLHFCNLNIKHLLPKLDELRIVMVSDKCPDILGLCETFLEPNVPDGQVSLDGYDLLNTKK